MNDFFRLRQLCQDSGVYTLNHLAILLGASQGHGAASIAKMLQISQQSVSMAINNMEVAGLVVRTRNGRDADARRCTFVVTADGKSLLTPLA